MSRGVIDIPLLKIFILKIIFFFVYTGVFSVYIRVQFLYLETTGGVFGEGTRSRVGVGVKKDV